VKNFFRNIFQLNSVEKSVFASLTCFLFGSWLILSWVFLFGNGLSALFRLSVVIFGGEAVSAIPWQVVFPVGIFLLFIHFICQHCRLLWRCDRVKFVIIVLLYAVFSAGLLFAQAYFIWLIISVLLWGFGIVFFCPSAWKAALCHGILLLLLFLCGYQIFRLFKLCGGYFLFVFIPQEAYYLPYWLWFFLLLSGGAVLAAGWEYAILGNFRFREIFTTPVKVISALALASYLFFVVLALVYNAFSSGEKALLAEQYGYPLTAEALSALCNDRCDVLFWEKIRNLNERDQFKRKNSYCFAEFEADELAQWQEIFETSVDFKTMDEMISRPLPGCPREINKGFVNSTLLENYYFIRYLGRYQVWRIRFASAENDRKEVMAALKRFDNLTAYFDRECFMIGGLCKMALISLKLQSMEIALSSGVLEEKDLLELKEMCRMSREDLAKPESRWLWGEAVLGIDFLEGVFFNQTDGNGREILPLYKFRFIFPQAWAWVEMNIFNSLKCFRGATAFRQVALPEKASDLHHFSSVTQPSFQSAADRIIRCDLELRCMEFFIDQELYFLRHGILPEDLPLPQDPFSGKAMKYTNGKVTVRKELANGEYVSEYRETVISARQLASPDTPGRTTVKTVVTLPSKAH